MRHLPAIALLATISCLAPTARAQPSAAEVWPGRWQCQVLRNDGSRLSITIALEVDQAGRLRGTFAGTVSGSLSGTATAGSARGTWSVGGRGGSFALELSAREAMSGDWNGEGGGKVSGQRELAAKPEDCPSFVAGYVLEDFRAPIGRQCEGPRIPDSAWGFRGDQHDRLERYLRRSSTLLGHRPDASAVGAACLARLGREGGLASIPEAERAARMAAVTADYYWSKKRLMDGVQASFESLAALDKLGSMDCAATGPALGRSSGGRLLEGVRCSEYGSSPGVAQLCDRYQTRCAGTTEYRGLLETTELALAQAEALRAELRRRSFTAEQRRAVEDMARASEATSPWLAGARFKQRYAAELAACKANPHAGAALCESLRPTFICQGIRAEAAENRNLVKGQLERFNQALRCLEGVGTECDVRRVRETVAKAPAFIGAPEPDLSDDSGPLEGDRKLDAIDTLYANSQFSQAECRQKLRQISDNINDELKGFAVDSALTIATFGLGAAAGAARLSASAASVVRTANATTKVSQMGQRAAAFARHGPRMLELAALGLDVADLSRGVAEAVGRCSDVFSRAGAVSRPAAAAPVCPQGGDYQGSRIVEDYRECVLKAIAWQAAFGALPVVPAAVSKLLDKRALARAAGVLSAGQPLSRSKADAVLAVFRRFGRMSDEELEAGIEALKKAGFTDDEVRKLFTRFEPDVRDLGGRLVHGLEGDVLAHAPIGQHTLSVARVGDALLVKVCSTCAQLDRFYAAQLARNRDLARRLAFLRREIDGLGPRAKVPRRMMDELTALTRDLQLQRRADFLNSHGIAGGNPPVFLNGVLKRYDSGHLSERQINKVAAAADEVVWELQRYIQRHPDRAARPGFDPMSVPGIRERVAAARQAIDSLHAADDAAELLRTKQALHERMAESLRTKELFFGGSSTGLLDDDLPFPRTTPELRAQARAEGSYRNPDGGKTTFGVRDPIEADHIYPVALLVKDPVFRTLPEKLQREVIYNQRNIQPLSPALNQSKGGRLADDWHRALKDGGKQGLDPGYLNWLRQRQAELKDLLEAQIRCLATGKPPIVCREGG
jgi:hypothetical protein